MANTWKNLGATEVIAVYNVLILLYTKALFKTELINI